MTEIPQERGRRVVAPRYAGQRIPGVRVLRIKVAGEALVAEARRQHPADTRCVLCGFGLQYHEPSNHVYQAPEQPFVRTLREYVSTVDGTIE